MTFTEICDEAFWLARQANRNGVVNASGYDADGTPIGGHLTADAAAVIASARWMLADIGAPWDQTLVVMPD